MNLFTSSCLININLISCSWLFYISYLYPSTLVVTTYSSILYYCTYICTVYSVLQSEHVLRAVTFHRFYCTVGLVPLLCTTFQLLTKYISYKHSKSLAWPTLWKTQCMVFWSYWAPQSFPLLYQKQLRRHLPFPLYSLPLLEWVCKKPAVRGASFPEGFHRTFQFSRTRCCLHNHKC